MLSPCRRMAKTYKYVGHQRPTSPLKVLPDLINSSSNPLQMHPFTFVSIFCLWARLALAGERHICEHHCPPDNTTTAIISDLDGQRMVGYFIANGFAIIYGDVIYGTEAEFRKVIVEDDINFEEFHIKRHKFSNLTEKRSNSVFPNSGQTWPQNTVPYKFEDAAFEASISGAVNQAIARWTSQVPCLKFVRISDANPMEIPNTVTIRRTTGDVCYASIGFAPGKASHILLAPGCGADEIAHELGHLLGLYHEHQRPDRELNSHFICSNVRGYPWVQGNIAINDQVCCVGPGTCCGDACQFTYISGTDTDGPYDLNSIMHYRRNAFSVDPATRNTLTDGPLSNPGFPSAGDIARVKLLYPCTPPPNSIAECLEKCEDPECFRG